MKEIRFGVVFASDSTGVAVKKEDGEVKIEFANGAELISEKDVIPTIAKEIERYNRKVGEFGVYSGYHGIFISDKELPWATKLFTSNTIKINDINTLCVIADDGSIKNIKRVKPTIWKCDDGNVLNFYNEKHIIRYLFEILLTEFEKDSDKFSISRNEDILSITLGGKTA